MPQKLETFISKYTQAIWAGQAAIFAGAGLSRDNGFVDWENLLRPLAQEIDLDIESEYDYLTLAQYYVNHTRSKNAVCEEILNCFTQDISSVPSENACILARLPINTYWTTNYDTLLEQAFQKVGRRYQVKTDLDNLPSTLYTRDAVLYKMHGDVQRPGHAVLTRQSYEQYETLFPFFREMLTHDLLSRTFLFIGFSFQDPNLRYILSHIKNKCEDNIKIHYCILKRVTHIDFPQKNKYRQQISRQNLKIEELKRYGIRTILVNDYSEITNILHQLERTVLRNCVFISGSADDFQDPWTQETAQTLGRQLAQELVSHDYHLLCGMGKKIGPSIVEGALTQIYETKFGCLDKYISLFPFPFNISPDKRVQIFTKYREDILAKCGVAIFMFGNKRDADSGPIIPAGGCLQEFEIAKKQGKCIIPIGSTGGAAEIIYNEIKANISEYPYLKSHINSLGRVSTPTKTVAEILRILKKLFN